MKEVHEGQCGLCVHFGENHPYEPILLSIRQSKQAPEALTEQCGHPKMSALHLIVTPTSGCQGFELAPSE